MDKRYQIFVSSTFEDLKEERKKVIESILNFSHIPAGMELFTASNDEQFEYIKKILDTCDYYVLIIGGRYGTINQVTGISYTEQEYDYAVGLGLPILAFIHETPYDLPSAKRDDCNRALFDAFIGKVKNGKLIKYWTNIDNLMSSVLIGLTYEFNNNPRLGWVRGEENNSPELLKQINDLRLEKEAIQKKYEELKEKHSNPLVEIENLAEMDELYLIMGTQMAYNEEYDETIEKQCDTYRSWQQIFSLVGPYLYSSSDDKRFDLALLQAFNFTSIDRNCVHTIRIQLMAYGLIEMYDDKFVKLSDKGKEQLLKIKTIKSSKRG